MTVFKGYLKIIRRNLAYMLGFFGIFTAICLLAANVFGGSQEEMFHPESVAIAVVTRMTQPCPGRSSRCSPEIIRSRSPTWTEKRSQKRCISAASSMYW